MRIYKAVPILMIFALSFAACEKTEDYANGNTSLEIDQVVVGHNPAKSVIDGPAFPQNEACRGIGLFLFASNSNDYDGKHFNNVKYSDNGNGWESDEPIMLSGTSAVLYGYFPYSNSISDITRIPVESSLNGTDYMYFEPVTGVSMSNRIVTLALKHALARVSVIFIKDGSYPGEGLISSISLSGEAIAEKGYMNASDGSISASASAVTFQLAKPDKISEEGIVEECLIVPALNSTGPQDMVLECVIDGQEFAIPLNNVTIKSGTQSTITVKASNMGLCVTDSSNAEWENIVTVKTEDGRTVTVQISEDVYENDILMSAYSEGNKVIIDALSLSGTPISIYVPDQMCTHTDGLDIHSRYFESTLSDISGDFIAKIGYDAVSMARTDVPNTAFYKDIFLDAGAKLDRCSRVPAAICNMYGLQNGSNLSDMSNWENLEFFNFSNADDESIQTQNSIFTGSENDYNGILLYPDGSPRFRLMYGYGGSASSHAETLGEQGCKNVNTFYANGGCYVASCASTILSAKKYGSREQQLSYDLLDGGATTFSGMYISNMRYYNDLSLENGTDFQKNYCNNLTEIKEVVHNGGCMLDESCAPAGTEVLARFASTAYPEENLEEHSSPQRCLNRACVWAYKRNAQSGRLVVCGSHPEICNTDDVTTLFTAELMYAMDGQGCATAKAKLENGVTRYMNLHKDDPSHCAIGDGQCHHFVIFFPKPVAKLSVSLDWDSKVRLDLAMKQGSFAFPDGNPDNLILSPFETDFITSPLELSATEIPAGMYYITVRCSTKPKFKINRNSTTYYFEYYGTDAEMQTLNGIPYNITAVWSYK